MSEERSQPDQELDCEVTVYDGSWGTCDMLRERPIREPRSSA
jgi:hypothetical protein